ncbi:hypothetical protein BR93DRAFT_939506 [Coniochaeta sp. PMI_546]|nr:hypothetical protein BR93DRAFT_939506 [Coniochaeta sp. PMI_546]
MASKPQAKAMPAKGDINEFNCEPITLNVGGKPFFTTIGTLVQRNSFFAAFLSGRWKVPKAEDGSIFIDSDPDVFSHILSFLSGGVFPLAYNPDTGHDDKLYVGILAQARYFSIPELECWLENACYRKAVSLVVITELMDEFVPKSDPSTKKPIPKEIGNGFDTVEIITWKKAVTPTWHNPSDMVSAAQRYSQHQLPPGGRYGSEEKTSFVVVRKKVCFDHNWCTTTGSGWEKYWAGKRRK